MAGLFDDLIPTADPNAAPALTVQGPGNVQGSPMAAAGPADPNAQAAPAAGMFDDLIPQDPGVLQHMLNAASRVPQNLSDKLNNMADGIPFSDRARAAVQAATGVGGKFGDYSGDLAATQAAAAQRMQQNPASAIMGQVAGGAVPALFGAGAASLPETLLGKVGTGASAGAATGGLYGASASPDLGSLSQTAKSTAIGAGLGATVGMAAPLIGAGAGAAYRGLASQAVPAVAGPGGAIGVPAQQLVMKALQNDNPAAVMANLRQFGDQGMMADYGPSLQGLAQGLATKEGPQQQAITAPLVARNLGTNARLGDVVDQHLGQAQSPLGFQAGLNNEIAPFAQAQQQAIRGAGPVDVSPVYKQLQNALPNTAPGSAEHSALSSAMSMLTEGDGPTTNAQRIYSARQALDDAINYSGPTLQAPSSAMRSQQGAFQSVRAGLSDALKQQVPGYEDATSGIAGLARQRGAVEEGAQALGSGPSAMRPDDFAAAYNAMSPEQQAAYRVGMRSNVDAALGTRANDLVALKGLTQGDNGWNGAKLGTAYGQDATSALNRSIDTESTFRNTYNQVAQNSATAKRQAMVKALADAEHEPFQIGETHNITMEGLAVSPFKMAANAALRAFQPAVDNTGRDLQVAQAVTAQGNTRNSMMAQLLAAHRIGQENAALGSNVANATTALTAMSPAALAAALRDYRQSTR